MAVDALYADDLKLWRSFDMVTQNKTEQMVTLAALNARWASDYRVIERRFTGDRVIQRHELTMTERVGSIVHKLQVAAFLTIRDGQVHALDEYIDSRDAALLAEDIQKSPNI